MHNKPQLMESKTLALFVNTIKEHLDERDEILRASTKSLIRDYFPNMNERLVGLLAFSLVKEARKEEIEQSVRVCSEINTLEEKNNTPEEYISNKINLSLTW